MTEPSGARSPFGVALAIAAANGVLALAYEILWYRAYAYVSEGAPGTFGFVLGAYLLGLAAGAWASGRYCEQSHGEPSRELPRIAAYVLAASTLCFMVVPTLGAVATVHLHAPPGHPLVAKMHELLPLWKWSLLLVAAAAGSLGAVLPLVAHVGIEADDRAGARLSYIYLANIIGSASGSLLTGFVLLDLLPLARVAGLLGAAGPLLALGIYALARPAPPRLAAATATSLALGIALFAASPRLHHQLYEKLLWGDDYAKYAPFTDLIENRHGVIAVDREGTLYGGGSYDGKFNVSLLDDRNQIVRAFAVAAMRPDARDILMVGLASGSWANVVMNQPGLERLTIIEINPGYLDLIRRRPEVAEVLSSPKVTVEIDDGHRWLLRHPDRRFDAIVMNTTWHYRGHASGLLSRDFLTLAGKHLTPGGFVYYNTTGSADVLATGLASFAHAVRINNCLAVGPDPITLDEARFKSALLAWRVNGQPVLDLSTERGKARFDEVVALAGPSPGDRVLRRDALEQLAAGAHIVTDDNMYCEWFSKDAPR